MRNNKRWLHTQMKISLRCNDVSFFHRYNVPGTVISLTYDNFNCFVFNKDWRERVCAWFYKQLCALEVDFLITWMSVCRKLSNHHQSKVMPTKVTWQSLKLTSGWWWWGLLEKNVAGHLPEYLLNTFKFSFLGLVLQSAHVKQWLWVNGTQKTYAPWSL